MRNKLVLIFALCLVPMAYADPKSPAKSSAEGEGASPLVFVSAHGGFALSTADYEVDDRWEHDTFSSYAMGVGVFAKIPPSWKQIHFFAGFDYLYIISEEQIQSSGSNTLLTTQLQRLMITGGVRYYPPIWNRRLGFGFFTPIEIWGEKRTKLQANGFTSELGTEKTHDDDFLIPLPVYFGWQVLFDITPQWQTFINYQRLEGDVVTVGANYGF